MLETSSLLDVLVYIVIFLRPQLLSGEIFLFVFPLRSKPEIFYYPFNDNRKRPRTTAWDL